jgi:hypothetical protein
LSLTAVSGREFENCTLDTCKTCSRRQISTCQEVVDYLQRENRYLRHSLTKSGVVVEFYCRCCGRSQLYAPFWRGGGITVVEAQKLGWAHDVAGDSWSCPICSKFMKEAKGDAR